MTYYPEACARIIEDLRASSATISDVLADVSKSQHATRQDILLIQGTLDILRDQLQLLDEAQQGLF